MTIAITYSSGFFSCSRYQVRRHPGGLSSPAKSRLTLLGTVNLRRAMRGSIDDLGSLELASFPARLRTSTFSGICLGIAIWPPSDPIGAAIIPYYVVANTLAVMLVALLAGLIMRGRSISNTGSRRAVWAAIIICVAFGPVTLALKSPIVRYRVAHNDILTTEGFGSLKSPVEKTKAGVSSK